MVDEDAHQKNHEEADLVATAEGVGKPEKDIGIKTKLHWYQDIANSCVSTLTLTTKCPTLPFEPNFHPRPEPY